MYLCVYMYGMYVMQYIYAFFFKKWTFKLLFLYYQIGILVRNSILFAFWELSDLLLHWIFTLENVEQYNIFQNLEY